MVRLSIDGSHMLRPHRQYAKTSKTLAQLIFYNVIKVACSKAPKLHEFEAEEPIHPLQQEGVHYSIFEQHAARTRVRNIKNDDG